ncbi:glycosyltransferase family 33 protein [Serpula lacrymans var. lacrymans S7.3]|uniref:Chitobiosyldiphosphodolichol beta-mannosyltransferase n=2 Tax=Serpula lacrymans var. lacrymans TaxID=341189 RepID=F8QG73_SERL3|nr:glycosyltransferase family 33 protein [Serpula lacrymans var. lacrymans S7.9]EGN92688.1 glycosyltransferase family 33 protein [Serpula lacrymans var. lacrymans S7.3]EGO19448.1 glycosyltransferase family 33 protein [Serpula lacrymans var. lacrymans S7.9]
MTIGSYALGLCFSISSACLISWIIWRVTTTSQKYPALRSVAILVLGDIGRSPRMMYHAESFAKIQFDTFLIGYRGSKPIPSLTSPPHVHLRYLAEPPSFVTKIPFIIAAPVKIIHQIATIFSVLAFEIARPPEFIMVQNPPSIPTLAIVWIVGHARGSKVIIDWHNLGYSILALKLGMDHIFVKVAKRFEAFFGKSAYAHLFVTQAMHDHLVEKWDLKGKKAVLHDRPPAHFHKTSPPEVHELFLRLGSSLTVPLLQSFLPEASPPYTTPFTQTVNTRSSKNQLNPTSPTTSSRVAMPTLRPDRPALLISSTSWTPDEDFSILLDALKLYENRARALNDKNTDNQTPVSTRKLPRIWMVITGKGPLKEKYMAEVGRLSKDWKWVRCTSLWLEAGDYPLLLGSADLGICLHSSSSALDLPMKVVDMFGCGLPVCALDFACLNELVKDGQNGLVFKNAQQLTDHMEALLASFPSSPALTKLRSSLISASNPQHLGLDMHGGVEGWEWNNWEENWNKVVKPLVLSDAGREQEQWK